LRRRDVFVNEKDLTANFKPKNELKEGENMKRKICRAVAVLLLCVFCLSACTGKDTVSQVTEETAGEVSGEAGENAISAQGSSSTGNSGVYNGEDLPDYLSQEQKEEIISLYNQAYEDEAAGLDTYINDYVLLCTGQSGEAYNPYAEALESLVGTTESLYQAVNQLDPNLKNELAALTEQKYGYLAGKGVQILLSDSEMVQQWP
jgi:hypothetical protein